MALIQYYENFVIVVNQNQYYHVYKIYDNEVPGFLKAVDKNRIQQWIDKKSAYFNLNFGPVVDWHVECQYITISFKNTEHQSILNQVLSELPS